MLTYSCDEPQAPGLMDDYTRLNLVGGGVFKEIHLHCGMLTCLELVLQYEKDAAAGHSATTAAKMARAPFR